MSKPKLKLISSNKEKSETFYTDNLIESGFSFIKNYLGDNVALDDIYFTGMCLMEQITCQGYFSTSPVYQVNEELWDNKVNINEVEVKQKKILIGGELLIKIREISNLYEEFKDLYEISSMNKQEVFSYSNYLLFENFLKHINGIPTSIKFPAIITVLQRKNLENTMRETLQQPKKFIFMANPYEEPHYHIGI